MSNESNSSLVSSKANTGIARWYAVQVASSCENKVKAAVSRFYGWAASQIFQLN